MLPLLPALLSLPVSPPRPALSPGRPPLVPLLPALSRPPLGTPPSPALSTALVSRGQPARSIAILIKLHPRRRSDCACDLPLPTGHSLAAPGRESCWALPFSRTPGETSGWPPPRRPPRDRNRGRTTLHTAPSTCSRCSAESGNPCSGTLRPFKVLEASHCVTFTRISASSRRAIAARIGFVTQGDARCAQPTRACTTSSDRCTWFTARASGAAEQSRRSHAQLGARPPLPVLADAPGRLGASRRSTCSKPRRRISRGPEAWHTMAPFCRAPRSGYAGITSRVPWHGTWS